MKIIYALVIVFIAGYSTNSSAVTKPDIPNSNLEITRDECIKNARNKDPKHPSKQCSLDLTTLVNMFLFPESGSYWNMGAEVNTPITWKTNGRESPKAGLLSCNGSAFGYDSPQRFGEIFVTKNGRITHTVLEKTIQPGCWDILLFGSEAQVDKVELNANSDIGLDYIFDHFKNGNVALKLLGKDNGIGANNAEELYEVKASGERTGWLKYDQSCGVSGANCSSTLTIFYDRNTAIKSMKYVGREYGTAPFIYNESNSPENSTKAPLKKTELQEKLQKITYPGLDFRNDIAYLPNENKPFTGKYETSYKNGQKYVEENYKAGKKNGLSTWWHENGQKFIEGNYKDDKENGLVTIWYENGQKEAETNYKDGKKNGLATMWYENGQKKAEVNYKDGKPNESNPEPNEAIQKIISRCRTQVGEAGAAIVKACVDQDIEAENALRNYQPIPVAKPVIETTTPTHQNYQQPKPVQPVNDSKDCRYLETDFAIAECVRGK